MMVSLVMQDSGGTFAYVNPNLDLIILILAQSRVGGNPGQEFIEAVEASVTK